MTSLSRHARIGQVQKAQARPSRHRCRFDLLREQRLSRGALWLIGRPGLHDRRPSYHRAFMHLAAISALDAAEDCGHPRRREALDFLDWIQREDKGVQL